MSKTHPEEVVRKYIDAKDRHDWDALVALLDPEYTSSDPSVAEPVKGIEAVSQYFQMLDHVDMKTKILTMTSKGDDVAAELAVSCTFRQGDEFAGIIAAENRSFEIKLAKFYRVNSRGLLVDEREYSDTAAKLHALGQEGAAAFQALGEEVNDRFQAPGGNASEMTKKASLAGLTPKSTFETRIPENLRASLGKVARTRAVYQFNITGNGGGCWYVDLTATPPAVSAGTAAAANCTITCTDSDFVDIVSGKLAGPVAFMTGKLKITGDKNLLLSLVNIIR